MLRKMASIVNCIAIMMKKFHILKGYSEKGREREGERERERERKRERERGGGGGSGTVKG